MIQLTMSGVLESVEAEITAARTVVDEEWSSRRLMLVPGEELLDRVLQRYDLRFRKERDGIRLAELLSASEIPRELSDLLHRIAPTRSIPKTG